MANFPLPVKAAMSDSFAPYSRILQFGDGYEQARSDGLNNSREVWNVEVAYPDAATDAILKAFLLYHGQHRFFQWQSPRDSAPRDYRIVGKVSGTKRNGGGHLPVFFTRQLQFEASVKQILPPRFPSSVTYSFPSPISNYPVSTTYSF